MIKSLIYNSIPKMETWKLYYGGDYYFCDNTYDLLNSTQITNNYTSEEINKFATILKYV